jgi:hypothetical protein
MKTHTAANADGKKSISEDESAKEYEKNGSITGRYRERAIKKFRKRYVAR